MSETLGEKIERLKKSNKDFVYKKTKQIKTSKIGRASADINKFQRFFLQIMSGLSWIFHKIVRPLFWWARKPSKWLLNLYIKIWTKFVYKKDEYNLPVFSQIRAGVAILATVLFVLILPFILQGLGDAGLYVTTKKINEQLILFGSQEVNALNGEHNIEGCPDLKDYEEKGCPDTETVYFRTKLTLFNEIWSMIYKRELYWPEYVGSAVPYTTSRCVADSYGVRIKLIMKDIEIYPTLLAVTCRPINAPVDKSKL